MPMSQQSLKTTREEALRLAALSEYLALHPHSASWTGVLSGELHPLL